MKEMGGYSVSPSDIKQSCQKVIFAGYFFGLWGHVLTDDLKKLWFLFSEKGKELLRNGWKVIYITMENKPLPVYVHQIFSLVGLDSSSWIWVKEPTCFKSVVIPDNSLVATEKGRCFSEEYIDIISRIKDHVLNADRDYGQTYEKIYLTRSQLKSNKDFGEKNIEKLFCKAGYTVISPEKYSVEQQIYFMLHCSKLATTEGSISHNAVFCKPKTEVIIIRKANYVNGYQVAINEAAKLDVTYIDSNRSDVVNPAMPWIGPFYLSVSPQLKKFLNISDKAALSRISAEYILYKVIVALKKLKRLLKN